MEEAGSCIGQESCNRTQPVRAEEELIVYGYIDLSDEYPHRERLLRLLRSNVARARDLAEQVDPASARHVNLYVSALLNSIETVETCADYGC